MAEAIPENTKWVIIEVAKVDGKETMFIARDILRLEEGWVGNIVWFVFTAGWELKAEVGVQFPLNPDGINPQPDPTRPGCWTSAAANMAHGEKFPYNINVQQTVGSASLTRIDPVVENEPPTP